MQPRCIHGIGHGLGEAPGMCSVSVGNRTIITGARLLHDISSCLRPSIRNAAAKVSSLYKAYGSTASGGLDCTAREVASGEHGFKTSSEVVILSSQSAARDCQSPLGLWKHSHSYLKFVAAAVLQHECTAIVHTTP